MSETESHRSAAASFRDRGADLAKSVSQTAGDAAQNISQAATAASEQVAAQVANAARDVVEEAALSRKQRAEHYLHSVERAVQAGAQQLDSDGLEMTAAYTRKAAGLIDGVASNLDKTDISTTARQVEDYMRARPVISFGAAALFGFAAYKLLKSGSAS